MLLLSGLLHLTHPSRHCTAACAASAAAKAAAVQRQLRHQQHKQQLARAARQQSAGASGSGGLHEGASGSRDAARQDDSGNTGTLAQAETFQVNFKLSYLPNPAHSQLCYTPRGGFH